MDVPLTHEEQVRILLKKEFECQEENHTHAAGHCGGIWDGILCWGDTPAGTTARQLCPAYFAGFNTEREATRECLLDGTWYTRGNDTWTDYTQCISSPSNITNTTKEIVAVIKIISQVGYGVSLATLVIAFIVLASFKRLRCSRNLLHLHLFTSFILRAGLGLLKDALMPGSVPPQLSQAEVLPRGSSISNLTASWSCKFLTSLWQYSIVANYIWILMEGLYLHNLIFLALFTDTSSITVYVVLGWALPAIFVFPWAATRALFEDTLCWTTHENSFYFLYIKIPIIFSIVINFGLFLNIVRVLLLKLTASISEEKRRFRYRRWAKSTLVLVPLFGVHYALFIGMSYSVGVHATIELIWLFCDQLFASFQGFFVAVLYCFMNGEVQTEVARVWVSGDGPSRIFSREAASRMLSRRSRPSTVGESCMTSFISTVPTDNGRNGLDPRRSIARNNETISETKLLATTIETPREISVQVI